MATPITTDVLQIRKYPNRRFYDATRSRHVRLQDIHQAIQNGCRVCVRDSKTNKDITNQVLGQIILNNEAVKLSIVPPEVLHHLIRSDVALWQKTLHAVATATATAVSPAKTVSGDMHSILASLQAQKSTPSRRVLISQLARQVDTLTERINELRTSELP